MSKPKRKFDYGPIAAALQQRMQTLAWKIFEAGRGEPDALIEDLRFGGDRQLSEQEGQALADLLEKLLRRRPANRPRGSLKPKNAAIKFAAHLMKVARASYRQQHGKRRAAVSEEVRDMWRIRAIELAQKEYRGEVSLIDADAVKAIEFKRIDIRNFVADDTTLPEAAWEMRQLVLQGTTKK